MPALNQEILDNMASYTLSERHYPPYPASHIVSDTTDQDFKDCACWAWALLGGPAAEGTMSLGDFTDAILKYDRNWRPSGVADEMIDPFGLGLTTYGTEMAAIKVLLSKRRPLSSVKDRKAFQKLYVTLIAKAYGLQPTDAADPPYTLHMEAPAERGWAWTHWGIGVRLPDDRISITQTVPGFALYQGCAYLWGDDPSRTTIGLAQLKGRQVAVLENIVAAPRRGPPPRKKLKV